MNVGGYQGAHAQPGLRAAVNSRLEEISFRTGMIAAAVAFAALLAIAAAAVYATAGHGGAAGAVTVGGPPGAVGGPPKAVPAASASPREPAKSAFPATSKAPAASTRPRAQQPVRRPVRTTSAQPAVTPWQQQAQAAGPSAPGSSYGWQGNAPARPGYGDPRLGGHAPWRSGPWQGGPGFADPGRGRDRGPR